MTTTLKRLFLLAAAFYLILAPVTYHPDTKLNLAYPTFGGGVWNIYGYLETHKLDVPPLHYPPFHYLLLKLELPLTQLIGGKGFSEWLLVDSTQAVSSPNIFQYNLASKFPLLVLTLLSGWLIYLLVFRESDHEQGALLAAAVWLFNPITLYSVVAMGQNDVVAIFIFLLGLWFYPKRPLVAFLLFGLSGSVKSYPLIWAGIMAMLYPSKSFIKKLFLGGFSVLIYIATLVPFMSSLYFREQVLNSGLVTRFFISSIDLGFGNAVLIVPVLITVILITALLMESGYSLFKASVFILAANFVTLGFSHFNPQWVLWLMPFWAMAIPFIEGDQVGRMTNRMLRFLTIVSFLLVVLLFQDRFLTWGIFSPLNPNLLNLPTIREFLALRFVNVTLYDNVAHSIFAGIGLSLVLFLPKILSLKRDIPLSLPQKIMKFLSKRESLLYKVGGAVVIPLALFAVLFIGGRSLPVVAMSETAVPDKIRFLSVKEIGSVSQPLVIANNFLYRVEVLLKNPNLASHDEFRLEVKDEKGRSLASQTVSGYNVGDPSYFRIDFSPVPDSADKTYFISIENVKVVDGKLAMGFNQEAQKQLIVREYAKQKAGISITSSLTELKRVVLTQPVVIALPIFSLLLL